MPNPKDSNKNLPYLFGARLRLLRDAMKVSQIEMAEMLGLPPYLLSRYEKGNSGSLAQSSRIRIIAQFFGIPMEWFISPVDDLDKPLPISKERIANLKSKAYLKMALRCSNFEEEDIPEMVQELEHTIETLEKWIKKKGNKAEK